MQCLLRNNIRYVDVTETFDIENKCTTVNLDFIAIEILFKTLSRREIQEVSTNCYLPLYFPRDEHIEFLEQ